MRSSAELRRPLEIEVMTDGSGKVAATVARELTALLQVIRRCAAYLRASLTVSDPRQKGVGEILTATERATSLTARLHAFSRSRVSRMEVPADPAPSQDVTPERRPARSTKAFRPSAISTIDRQAD